MDLTCTCSHKRVDHDGGKKAINDRRIGVCSTQNCNCQEYHADKESRTRQNELLLSALSIPAILAGVCVIGFFLAWVAIDYSMEDYTVTTKYEYKKFLNGEEVENDNPLNNKSIDPKYTLGMNMKLIVGFILLSVAMFGSMFSVDAYYTSKLKQLRNGELK